MIGRFLGVVAVAVVTAVSARAVEYTVTDTTSWGAAIAGAKLATEDVTISVSGAINNLSPTLFYNQNAITINFIGTNSATVKGALTVYSVSKATIIITDVRFPDGITDQSGKVQIVDSAEDAAAFPASTVILPSGQRQVYFGFPKLKGVMQIDVQVNTSQSLWESLAEEDLIRRDETSAEPTIDDWQSIRYTGAQPNETRTYRLMATTANGDTFFSEETSVTTAPAGTLHSRPGAKATIYLDFDGYVDDYRANVAMMKATFASSARGELSYIRNPKFSERSSLDRQEIWRLVAEDFLIFDVDVTTEEPPLDRLIKASVDDDAYGKRVVIDCLADGTAWYPSGGMSGLGAFGFRTDRPAYVFGYSTRDNIAAQITHEVSHTCGLAHDEGPVFFDEAIYYNPQTAKWETLKNTFVDNEYYAGQTIYGNCRWYPVMGGVPMSDGGDYLNQFANGNYDGAAQAEDDLAVMLGLTPSLRESEGKNTVVDFPAALYPNGGDPIATRNLTLIADDAGDTVETAKPYVAATEGMISKHVSGTTVAPDCDIYSLVAAPGPLTVRVSPEYRNSCYGVSLDAKVELLDATGAVLASSQDPLDNDGANFRKAELTATVTRPGYYYVRVSGGCHDLVLRHIPEGRIETEWRPNAKNNYGSIGAYKLTVDYQPGELPEPTGKLPTVLFR